MVGRETLETFARNLEHGGVHQWDICLRELRTLGNLEPQNSKVMVRQ